ncbi:hypothetical protein TWF106_007322 [Orbilia oligospora]|nr:hypothetical protein TWF106_007322 [Orbilia oligospora]
MGLGNTKTGWFTALIPILPMWFSTWETYHTHTLYLGYFNGPTEGLIIACLCMALSGVYGPHIWHEKIADTIGYQEIFHDYSFKDLWFPVIFSTFIFIHLPFCVKNVVSARRAQGLPVLPVFLEWTPILTFTAAGCAWAFSPYTTLRSENHIVLFCLTLSFAFGRMTTKVILAHLLRQPFPYWTVMLVPLIGGAFLVNTPPLLGYGTISAGLELWYLRGYFVFALVVYFNWAVKTIDMICGYLGIKCLTIPYQEENGRVKNT